MIASGPAPVSPPVAPADPFAVFQAPGGVRTTGPTGPTDTGPTNIAGLGGFAPPAGFADIGAGFGNPAAAAPPGGGDFQLPEQGMLPGYRPLRRRPMGGGGY